LGLLLNKSLSLLNILESLLNITELMLNKTVLLLGESPNLLTIESVLAENRCAAAGKILGTVSVGTDVVLVDKCFCRERLWKEK